MLPVKGTGAKRCDAKVAAARWWRRKVHLEDVDPTGCSRQLYRAGRYRRAGHCSTVLVPAPTVESNLTYHHRRKPAAYALCVCLA